MSDINPDAKITLYGGSAVGLALLAVAVATGATIVIGMTGIFFIGTTLLIAGLFNQLAPEPEGTQ